MLLQARVGNKVVLVNQSGCVVKGNEVYNLLCTLLCSAATASAQTLEYNSAACRGVTSVSGRQRQLATC